MNYDKLGEGDGATERRQTEIVNLESVADEEVIRL